MKAILVFDINDLTYKGIEDGFINEITLHLEHHGFYEIKDVELKPMPQERDIFEQGYDEEDTRDISQWNKGYNACIDEIIGEEE